MRRALGKLLERVVRRRRSEECSVLNRCWCSDRGFVVELFVERVGYRINR